MKLRIQNRNNGGEIPLSKIYLSPGMWKSVEQILFRPTRSVRNWRWNWVLTHYHKVGPFSKCQVAVKRGKEWERWSKRGGRNERRRNFLGQSLCVCLCLPRDQQFRPQLSWRAGCAQRRAVFSCPAPNHYCRVSSVNTPRYGEHIFSQKHFTVTWGFEQVIHPIYSINRGVAFGNAVFNESDI